MYAFKDIDTETPKLCLGQIRGCLLILTRFCELIIHTTAFLEHLLHSRSRKKSICWTGDLFIADQYEMEGKYINAVGTNLIFEHILPGG